MGVIWTELDAGRCVVLDDAGESVRIRHPDAGRPKYFVKSRAGNWVWVSPSIDAHGTKEGYIVKGELRGVTG